MPDVSPVRPQPLAVDTDGLLGHLGVRQTVVRSQVCQRAHPELVLLATSDGPSELPDGVVRPDQNLDLHPGLASILCGAAIYGLSQQTGNYSGGYLGKRLALAGAIGACLAGIAPTVINLLFKAAS